MLAPVNLFELRAASVLISLNAPRTRLTALLPVDDRAGNEAREALLRSGFQPETAHNFWSRDVALRSLDHVCEKVWKELGASALWDLGSVFVAKDDDLRTIVGALPSAWPGRFMLHVRGTPHCLVFDRATSAAEIERCYAVEWESYLMHEYTGSE